MAGPPAGVNWNGPRHEILHEWHIRMEQQLDCNGFRSRRYLAKYRTFPPKKKTPAGGQVDQICVGLAPTSGKTWTNIYDLGLTITVFCPVDTS